MRLSTMPSEIKFGLFRRSPSVAYCVPGKNCRVTGLRAHDRHLIFRGRELVRVLAIFIYIIYNETKPFMFGLKSD